MQDRQLIETLFRRHYERMFLTARTLLRNPEEARDVVSDVFAELMESRQTLDMTRVESYLLVSVRNKCLNIVSHRMVVERGNQQITKETVDEDYSELPLDDILNYIDQHLTPQTRIVIMKRYGENRKYNEISEELGISRIAVYKHITQALTKLKKQFVWKS